MSDIPDEGRGPTTRERRHELTSQSPDDLKKRLTDEYKILQDKIDKIGAFRFTIKGWAITAVGAATAAATATKSLAVAGVVSVGLAILVVFFFKFEIEQVRLSRLFGSLAGKIERAFHEIDTQGLRRGFRTPAIGGEIVKAREIRRQRRRFKWWLVWPLIDVQQRSARQIWWGDFKEDWAIRGSAHITFYLFLFILAFVPVAAQYRALEAQTNRAWSYYNPPPPVPPAPPGVSKVSAK
jgi:hypothetical protein